MGVFFILREVVMHVLSGIIRLAPRHNNGGINFTLSEYNKGADGNAEYTNYNVFVSNTLKNFDYLKQGLIEGAFVEVNCQTLRVRNYEGKISLDMVFPVVNLITRPQQSQVQTPQQPQFQQQQFYQQPAQQPQWGQQ